MPETRDVGRFYAHGLKYPLRGAPLVDRALTTEVEPPYREGRGVVVRLGRRRAVVVGRWYETGREEDAALYEALKAQSMDVGAEEVSTW